MRTFRGGHNALCHNVGDKLLHRQKLLRILVILSEKGRGFVPLEVIFVSLTLLVLISWTLELFRMYFSRREYLHGKKSDCING